MKLSKSLLSLLLCVVIVFSLCQCTWSDNPDETTETSDISSDSVSSTEDGNETESDTGTDSETDANDAPSVMYYDDYLAEIGSISASAANAEIVQGDSLEIVTVNGVKYFHAIDTGSATVSDGTSTYNITVEKAKINIIVIMGQSNSGNHFDNATSDITCPIGTAYWWGNGRGTAATEPVNFTQATKGFHSPLLAELYAQSVKNGTPEKNVLVWHEGGNQNGNGTSKNGSSIYGWATSATDSSGTDYTVTMVNNCVKYYTERSDKYEIVSKGVYWLQGEGDGVRGIDPVHYSECFMAMWNKLKSEAGLEYIAIMRVRRGGDNNTLNNDINYSTTVSAQFALANKYPDIFMATTITENWTGAPTAEKSINIEDYITLMEKYSQSASHNDTYGNAATYADGVLTTTMKTLFGSNNKNHYGKFGYALIAADAAYNMYNALHGDAFAIMQADTSGRTDEDRQNISKAGTTASIDITDITDDLAFRASCGSTAGTLSIKIMSGSTDITDQADLINASGENYGSVNVKKLKTYENVTITVTYTPVSGTPGSVTYTVVDNSIDLPDELPASYVWNFDGDLYARDKDGNIVNMFGATALNGSYSIENGVLKCNKLQLQIEKAIELKKENNWSIEIKFGGSVSGGFILATEKSNVVGNKAISHRGGKFNISDYDTKGYATKAGYYNYASDSGTISANSVMKLVNTYDPQTGTSVMSLWKDGVLVVENMQSTGDFNGSTGTIDLSQYPVLADFSFAYLGCSNSSGSFLVTEEIDYIKVDTNIS